MNPRNPPHDALAYHVSGAIARGDAVAITEESARDQSQAAFNRALRTGRLSNDPKAPNYVAHFMFMGFAPDGAAAFKHRDTRKYLP